MDGKRLKWARERRGITQEELAEKLGVSLRTITRYENQSGDDLLRDVSQALDVSADYLLGLSNDPNPRKNDEISNEEYALISAIRAGDVPEALKIMASSIKGAFVS
jgi:transcriptional regulator with XRE-family HTH domain